MRRFVRNLLIFVIIISIVTAAANFAYGVSHRATPVANKFIHIPDTIQICNFGTSHGKFGFNYEDLEDEYDCFNFGLEGQFLSYDYRLFQYYADHIGEGAVVFIPVSYPLLFGPEESSRDEFASKNKRYYSILPASLIKECDMKTYLFVKYFPALASNTTDLFTSLLGIDTQMGYWQRVATDIDVAKNGADAAEGFIGNKSMYDDDGNRIENREEIDALYAMVKGCQEKGAIPILITTPFLHEYTDPMKKNAQDFYDHFYSIIDRVVRETGAEYYDYAFDERFASEYSWFIDTTHLNKEGARNFTNILMEDIVYAKGYLDK